MAAPHAAGVAAMLLARDGTLGPAGILAQLRANALPRSPTECPLPCGAGLLNANITVGPQPPRTDMTLSPTQVTVEVGSTAELVATVITNGAPDPNKTTTFISSNPLVATVAPASVTTDASGTARATVTGAAPGDTTVTAESQGVTRTAAVAVPVRMPSLPLRAATLSLLAALIAYAWRHRRSA
jgi:serine protease